MPFEHRPKCKVCGALHFAREPHQFSGKVEPPVTLASPQPGRARRPIKTVEGKAERVEKIKAARIELDANPVSRDPLGMAEMMGGMVPIPQSVRDSLVHASVIEGAVEPKSKRVPTSASVPKAERMATARAADAAIMKELDKATKSRGRPKTGFDKKEHDRIKAAQRRAKLKGKA